MVLLQFDYSRFSSLHKKLPVRRIGEGFKPIGDQLPSLDLDVFLRRCHYWIVLYIYSVSPIGIAGDNTEYRPGDDFWVSSGLFLGLVLVLALELVMVLVSWDWR